MLSYMKSEIYHVLHEKTIYIAATVLPGLTVLMNVMLAVLSGVDESFRYGTVRFSLNMLTGLMIAVVYAAIAMGSLLTSDKKTGVLKNIVATGLSREKIFIGKCLVTLLFSVILLILTVGALVASAYLLLENREWEPLRQLLSGILTIFPFAVATMMYIIVVSMHNDSNGNLIIMCFLYLLFPHIIRALSMVDVFGVVATVLGKISSWLPLNMLNYEVNVWFSSYDCFWDKPGGLARGILAGIAWIVIMSVAGIRVYRKQDL